MQFEIRPTMETPILFSCHDAGVSPLSDIVSEVSMGTKALNDMKSPLRLGWLPINVGLIRLRPSGGTAGSPSPEQRGSHTSPRLHWDWSELMETPLRPWVTFPWCVAPPAPAGTDRVLFLWPVTAPAWLPALVHHYPRLAPAALQSLLTA